MGFAVRFKLVAVVVGAVVLSSFATALLGATPAQAAPPTISITESKASWTYGREYATVSSSALPSTLTWECRIDSQSYAPCWTYNGTATTIRVARSTLVSGDGTHDFFVRAKNSLDEYSNEASYSFVLDSTRPVVTIDSVSVDGTIQPGPVTFTFSVSEPSTVGCRFTNNTTGADEQYIANCTSPVTVNASSPGSWTFNVTASDSAGWQGGASSGPITVYDALSNYNYPFIPFTIDFGGGNVVRKASPHDNICRTIAGTLLNGAPLVDTRGNGLSMVGGGTLTVKNQLFKTLKTRSNGKKYTQLDARKAACKKRVNFRGLIFQQREVFDIDGKDHYYTWGLGDRFGQSSLVERSNIRDEKKQEIASWGNFDPRILGCVSTNPSVRGEQCNGRDAPDLIVKNEPRAWTINPRSISKNWFYKDTKKKFTNLDNYGTPAYDPPKGKFGRDHTPLMWSDLSVPGGGINRAQLSRGSQFIQAAIPASKAAAYACKGGLTPKKVKRGAYCFTNGKRPKRTNSKPKQVGWVVFMYGHVKVPDGTTTGRPVFGWATWLTIAQKASPFGGGDLTDIACSQDTKIVKFHMTRDVCTQGAGGEVIYGRVASFGSTSGTDPELEDFEVPVEPTPEDGLRATGCVGCDAWGGFGGIPVDDQLLGDVDGDGDDDAITYDSDAGDIAVAKSDNGAFASSSIWLSGLGSEAGVLRVADVTGDGKSDAVLYDADAGTITVARSEGGHFVADNTWGTGFGFDIDDLLLGDVNGDNRADAVAFDYTNGDWWVMSSDGAGFSGAPQRWISGHGVNADSAMLGDVDGDGDDDAVSYFNDTGRSYVSKSNRSGFEAASLWTDGPNEQLQPRVADVNGDQKTDLVLVGIDDSQWLVGLSTGDEFLDASKWLDAFGSYSDTALLGDVTGDGLADAVTADQDDEGWSVGPSRGDAFEAYGRWSSNTAEASAKHRFVDVTGDGKADDVHWNSNSPEVRMSRALPYGFAASEVWVDLGSHSGALLEIADADGDGLGDLIMTDNGQHSVFVGLSNGSSFAMPTTWSDQLPALGQSSLHFSDLDGDSDADLVLADPQSGVWNALISDGSSYAAPAEWADQLTAANSKTFVADVNADGNADAVLFDESTATWQVALSDGDAFGDASEWRTGFGEGANEIFLTDVNNDDRADAVAFSVGESAEWTTALSDGASFEPTRLLMADAASGSVARAFADVTGDGFSDAVFIYAEPTETFVNPKLDATLPDADADEDNLVGFTFPFAAWRADSANVTNVLSGDVDGDGREDAVEFNTDMGRWNVYRSNGSAELGYRNSDDSGVTSLWALGLGVNSRKQFVADVNGDQLDDAIVVYTEPVGFGQFRDRWVVGLSDGEGDFLPLDSDGFDAVPWAPTHTHYYYSTDYFVGDVTGEGRNDLVTQVQDTQWFVAESQSAGADEPESWISDFGRASEGNALADKFMLGDVTGDGRDDLVAYFDDSFNDSVWRRAESTGSSFTNPDDEFVLAFGKDAIDFFVSDVSGDGTDDAIAVTESGDWQVARSDLSFDEQLDWAIGFGASADERLLADATGDGLADAIAFETSETGISWLVEPAFDLEAPDTDITDGPDATTPVSGPSVEFEFTGSPGATFECATDQSVFAPCTSPFTADASVEGTHSFSVRSVDKAGNEDPDPAVRPFEVDLTPPDTFITSGPDDAMTIDTAEPEFSFQSNESGAFECKVDGQVLVACTSPLQLAPLSLGQHTFEVAARDRAGNTDPTPETRTFEVATAAAAPDTAIAFGPTSPSSDRSPQFGFDSPTGADRFQCRTNAGAWEWCISPYVTRVPNGISEEWELEVRAVNSAGVADSTPASHVWSIDTQPPGISITSPEDDLEQELPTVEVYFDTSVATTIECAQDGGSFVECSSPATFNFDTDGTHTIEIRVFDELGNVASDTVTVNIQSGLNTGFSLSPPALTNEQNVPYELRSDSAFVTFECRMDDAAWLPCDRVGQLDLSALDDGPHVFWARSTRLGVHDDAPVSRELVIDRTPPVLEITRRPADITNEDPTVVEFETNESLSSAQCVLAGDTPFECESPVQLPELVGGTHTFAVYVADEAGNFAPPSWFTFTVDTDAPETVIDSGPDPATDDRTPTFTFSSLEPTATFECSIDAGEFANCASPFTTPSLSSGTHSVAVRAVDAAGNIDPTPAVSQFDVVGPELTITSPTSGQTIHSDELDVEFTHSADVVSVSCQLDDGQFDYSCVSPKQYVRDYYVLQNGQHEIKVTATDNLGRSTTVTTQFTVDFTRPQTIITDGPSSDILVGEGATYYFESDDPYASFECATEPNGEPATNWVPCVSPYTTPPATERGAREFYVRAVNVFGGVDQTPMNWWHLAVQPLTVPIVSGPAGVTSNTRPRFVLGDIEYGEYYCQIDDDPPLRDCGNLGPGLPVFQMPTLPDGEHTFKVWSKDGSRESEATVRTFVVDSDNPVPDTVFDHVPPPRINGPTAATEYFSFHSTIPGARFECRHLFIGPGYPDYGDWVGWGPCGSPTPLNQMSNHHVFEIRAVANGSVDPTPLSYEVNVDISAPEPYITAGPDGTTSDNTPTFEWTLHESATDPVADHYMCSIDSGPFELCETPFTLPELSDGEHSFAVWAYDEVGNRGGRNGYRSFTVDTGGTAVNDTSPPDTQMKLPAPKVVEGLYRVETLVIELTASEQSTFECAVDDGSFDPCEIEWLLNLDAGVHTLKARAIDVRGNVDPTPAEATFTIDGTAPIVTIVSPANGATYTTPNVPVEISVSEPGPTACVVGEVFEFANWYFNCHESLSEFVLGEGTHTMFVAANDQAGNFGQAASTFNVELPPETSIDSGPVEGEVLTSTATEFTFSSEPGATFECSLDGESFSTCSSPFATGQLSPGDHTFEVRSLDSQGTPDPTPAGRSFSVTGATLVLDEGTGVLTYDDASGINNDLLVSIEGDDLVIHDAATAISVAEGCVRVDINTIRCPLASVTSMVINVNDGADRVVVTAALDVVVNGGEGDDVIITDLADDLNGGPGDDLLDGGPGPDEISGGEGTDTVTYATRSEGVTVTLDDVDNDGATGEGDNVATDVENIVGGEGSDTLTGSDADNRIEGHDGNDILTGGSGADQLDGGDGEDTLRSRDALNDSVTCGDDEDFASSDLGDLVDASCENVKTAPNTSIAAGPYEGQEVSNTTPTFEFTADEGDVGFRCQVDDGPVTDCGAQYSTPALDDGPHLLTVTAVDFFGNADPSPETRGFVVDTAPPTMSITSPSVGQHLDSNSVAIEFVDDGSAATVTCQVNGQTPQPCSSPFVTVLPDGSHTVTVAESDLAQNTSTDSVAFTVDTSPPVVSLEALNSSPTNDTSPSFSVTADDDHIATVTCEVDGGGAVPCGGVFTTMPLTDGPHTVTLTASDIAGNEATTSTVVVIDATPPTTTMSGPSGLQTDSTPTYVLTTSESGSTFECKVDGGAYGTVTSPYTTPDLVAGAHTIYCRAVDAAGNVGPVVSKSTTIGTPHSDPSTSTLSGGWGAFCTPLDFVLPLGCPSGIISKTIPAHPNGLSGNYQVSINGWMNRICNLVGVAPGYTLYVIVDGAVVASQYKNSLFDFFCLNPVWLSATKLGHTLSAATSHTISISVRSSVQLSAFPNNSGSGLTVDITQL